MEVGAYDLHMVHLSPISRRTIWDKQEVPADMNRQQAVQACADVHAIKKSTHKRQAVLC